MSRPACDSTAEIVVGCVGLALAFGVVVGLLLAEPAARTCTTDTECAAMHGGDGGPAPDDQ